MANFFTFFGGFKLTLQHLSRPTVTTSYPQAKRAKQPRQHGRHVLSRYEDGMEKCIGCELCAGACPVDCIYVRGLDNPPDHPVSPGERYGYVYEINYLRCIHCDLCVEACPVSAPGDAARKAINLEAIERGLKVMDTTALSLCMDNHLPIHVFELVPGNVARVLAGERTGTLISTAAPA